MTTAALQISAPSFGPIPRPRPVTSRPDAVIGGAAELGVDLDAHIQFVIDAMRAEAPSLGLEGTPA